MASASLVASSCVSCVHQHCLSSQRRRLRLLGLAVVCWTLFTYAFHMNVLHLHDDAAEWKEAQHHANEMLRRQVHQLEKLRGARTGNAAAAVDLVLVNASSTSASEVQRISTDNNTPDDMNKTETTASRRFGLPSDDPPSSSAINSTITESAAGPRSKTHNTSRRQKMWLLRASLRSANFGQENPFCCDLQICGLRVCTEKKCCANVSTCL